MRILSASVTNFASYKELSFEFTDKGLTLVSGPTGAGKSTLCDVIPWILFGRTSKDGSVDEIRSWNAEEDTKGQVHIHTGSREILIRRVRGKFNDLEMVVPGNMEDHHVRGKDIVDTQKLINQELGFDAETYLSGAYFHEFSQTAQFFSTTAKNRRLITEQMADLKIAKGLSSNLTEYRRELKKDKEELDTQRQLKANNVSYLQKSLDMTSASAKSWNLANFSKIQQLQVASDTFEETKAAVLQDIRVGHAAIGAKLDWELKDLEKNLLPDDYFKASRTALDKRLSDCGDTTCNECGSLKNSTQRLLITKELHKLSTVEADNERVKINITRQKQSIERHDKALEVQLKTEKDRQNTYVEQISSLQAESNPHDIAPISDDLQLAEIALADVEAKYKAAAIELSDAELLTKVNEDFRAKLVKNTIVNLEQSTNKLLTEYFDGEIRVKFDISVADRLEVVVMKDGNTASYSQLSKGQRGLLKLAFGVAVMRQVSNHNGVDFNCVFFDEVFSGLDETIKSKSFRLLQSLEAEYESIFVIDHSEDFKNLFHNKYEVSLIDGNSQIEEV